MRVCPDCLHSYKLRMPRKKAKKLGIPWGRGHWPEFVYHNEPHRKCKTHNVEARVKTAKRRADEIKACPPWADKKAIREIYAECVELSNTTGVKYEVDHIVPLRGVNVCGLHIAANLQAIPATENRKKSNKF